MYKIEIEKQISDDLRRLEVGQQRLRRMIVRRIAEKALSRSQKNYLTGQVLNIRSGRLRSSGFVRMEGNDAAVGFGVKYARIHEEGGDIYPKRAKALKFKVGDRWVTTQHVKMPKRPYAKPAIEDTFRSDAGRIANRTFVELLRRQVIR